VDKYGRWVVDSSKFPQGIAAVARCVHGLGLQLGFYLTPGIPVAAYNRNTAIENTRFHARDIDPGQRRISGDQDLPRDRLFPSRDIRYAARLRFHQHPGTDHSVFGG
jgi:hypothetical protein